MADYDLRDPRFPEVSPLSMEQPRYPVPRDLIALQRRWLLKGGLATHLPSPNVAYRKFAGAPAHVPVAAAKQRAAAAPRAGYSELTMLEYRYTKGSPIVNDALGYGERITEALWQVVQTPGDAGHPPEKPLVPKLKCIERVSQRTKSGRQMLKEVDPSRAEALMKEKDRESASAPRKTGE